MSDSTTAAWHPIETAPRDGSPILATGWNWGECSRGWHLVVARWDVDRWVEASEWNPGSILIYLTHWMSVPYVVMEPPHV